MLIIGGKAHKQKSQTRTQKAKKEVKNTIAMYKCSKFRAIDTKEERKEVEMQYQLRNVANLEELAQKRRSIILIFPMCRRF